MAGRSNAELMRLTGVFLSILAGIYVVKESLQLLRRWFVQRTTARIERNMTVRLVGHLLKVDLGALARNASAHCMAASRAASKAS